MSHYNQSSYQHEYNPVQLGSLSLVGDYDTGSFDEEEFNKRYQAVSADTRKIIDSMQLEDGTKVAWCAQPGSQEAFLSSTAVFEVLYHGTRGPGKTDALLMSFAMHVGKGYGNSWRGVIFRETYPQLADIVAKSEKWFKLIFGDTAKFNKTKMMWVWDTGEFLLFRHMASPADYWNYHGHEYPFIGWEELTNWVDDECYKSMMSCCRSSHPDVPRMIRATTNPYGVGHGWIKTRFNLAGQWWKTVIQMEPKDPISGEIEKPRAAIHGHINENKILLAGDPDYKRTIATSATNKAMSEAWLHGSWDIAAGGIFSDVWDVRFNVVKKFKVPKSWRIVRSFDWGSSRPFSYALWAVSDGTDYEATTGVFKRTVKGDMFRIFEWYGWNGKANKGLNMLATDIAKGIIKAEVALGYHKRVEAGPADASIYNTENGVCIATDMARYFTQDGVKYKGVVFIPSDKRPGTRIGGWERTRVRMKNAHPPEHGVREEAGLFVFEDCAQFLRTIPSLPRDELNMDDVDTDSEDHIADEMRYTVQYLSVKTVARGRSRGMV